MRCAKLLLRIPGNWVSEVSARCNASIKVMKCVPWEDGTGRSLVRIETPADLDGETLARSIKDVNPACQISLSSAGPGAHIAAVTNNACAVCGVLNEANCFLDSAVSQPDGRVAWSIIAPSSKNLSDLVERLRKLNVEVEVMGTKEQDDESLLTYHQEKILRIAFDLGYYDIPRRINLDEFSAKLDLSKSTLDVILRRAERKLIGDHIDAPRRTCSP